MAARVRRFLVAASVAVVLLLRSAAAVAQIPLGSEFRVDTQGAHQGYPLLTLTPRAVSVAPDGRFVVAWMTPGVPDIAARRFAASGRARGLEFVVNTQTAGQQFDESIAIDDDGNFVVAWSCEYYGDLRASRFDPTGAPVGAEFQVNQSTPFPGQAMVAMAPGGGFIVVWSGAPSAGTSIKARRYDASGAPVAGEFQVNAVTTALNEAPSVAYDASGNFVVVWQRGTYPKGFYGRRYTAAGASLGAEFQVQVSPVAYPSGVRVGAAADGAFVVSMLGNGPFLLARRFGPSGAPRGQEFSVFPSLVTKRDADIAVDADGDFVIVWEENYVIRGRRFDAAGTPANAFEVSNGSAGFPVRPAVASDPAGNFVVSWHSGGPANTRVFARRYAAGLLASALSVDPSPGPASNGNAVLEPGETVAVAPRWLNGGPAAQAFTGTASAFTGPGAPNNPAYAVVDAAASYGTVASGALGSCQAAADCYAVGIGVPAPRPAVHWDASLEEQIAPTTMGAVKTWLVHVGASFSDVAPSGAFYRFVETLLHHDVTGGCAAGSYCPLAAVSRSQMAVFVLVSREGSGYRPAACGAPTFADVPATSPFCPWVEELARRGVVAGCGGGNYCPDAAVTREQMAIFLLRALDAALNPPACGTPMFSDVPASSPFCRWVEELARRGAIAGCGGGAYCPSVLVSREQMGVFLSVTFGLSLYGP